MTLILYTTFGLGASHRLIAWAYGLGLKEKPAQPSPHGPCPRTAASHSLSSDGGWRCGVHGRVSSSNLVFQRLFKCL
jgi:hypothetical protein